MKTLKTLQQGYDGYRPKAGDEQKFKEKHVVKVSKLSKSAEDDDVFKAANVKAYDRQPTHGYNNGDDEDVYEEKITAKDVKMAVGVAKDKRYAGGNMTGASKVMDKIKPGLSKHPAAQKALRQANEEAEQVAEADDKGLAAAHKKAQAVSKKEGVVQHIEKHPQSGHHSVSDWYDSDRTVASYNNGKLREEAEHIYEGGMPSSVIKHKERIKAMSDQEFFQAHKDKSEEDLKSMAWRHGYGPGHKVYVDKHKRGQSVAEGLVKYIRRSLAGWGAYDNDGPADVIKRVKGQDTDTLKSLSHRGSVGKGSPAELQQKAIGHELKKRGVAEETEQVDEKLSGSDSTSNWIHDFVHSKNPKFEGKSTKERIRMALGAKYAKEEVEVSLSESKEAKSLYHQHHATVMDLLKKVGEGVKQHKAAIESDPTRNKDNAYHYGHVGDMKNYKNQLEDMHQQITQMGEYAKPPSMVARMHEEVEPAAKRSLGKIMEAMKNKEPVGVKIHYTHPEKKATWATHFTAKDAHAGEKEMSSQGYKVKKRELVYGKAGA